MEEREGIHLRVVGAALQDAVPGLDQHVLVDMVLEREEDVLGASHGAHQPVGVQEKAEIGDEHPLQPDRDKGHEPQVRPRGFVFMAVEPDIGVPDLPGKAQPEFYLVVLDDVIAVGEAPGVELEGGPYRCIREEKPVLEKYKLRGRPS